MVHLLIDINAVLHSELKHRAIDQKMTLKDLVIQLLESGVRQDSPRDLRPPRPAVTVQERSRYGSFVGVGE